MTDAEKMEAPWGDIGRKEVPPAEPGPLAELADELADREVARLLVNAVVQPERSQPKTTKGAIPASRHVSCFAKLLRFSTIQPQRLRWLWPQRIPLGKLTLLVGDPGLGKSLVTLDAAARLSRGTPWPDGTACELGESILLSAEDDAGDTIRPRLDAARADVSRLHLLESVRMVTADGASAEAAFSLERDIPALEDALDQSKAKLVIIDPISAYLGRADSHTNAEIRGLLAPLYIRA